MRLAGAPIFVFLFAAPAPTVATASLALLAILLLTDVLDGALARQWKVTSAFGYVLDGVADRSTNIALIVALASFGALPAVLAFFLLLRDVLLYAARSLFPHWWRSNHIFRVRVRVTAVAFNVTVSGIAIVVHCTRLGWTPSDPSWMVWVQPGLVACTWVLALWSYVLLAAQVRAYNNAPPEVQS